MDNKIRNPNRAFKNIRKILGISCAGGIFAGSGLALMHEVPLKLEWLYSDFTIISAFFTYALLVIVCSVYTMPFDYLSYKSGVRFRKLSMSRRQYLYCWIRGVFLQLLLLPSFALSINLAGRAGGKLAAFLIFSLSLIFLSMYRGEFSRFIKGHQFRLFVPRGIKQNRGKQGIASYCISILWNQSAFLIAMNIPFGGVVTITETVITILAFTSFSLLGWLFIPFIGKKHQIGNAILALDLSWAGANLVTRSVCTHVGNPNKWIGYKG
ncbi:MAG: hypothetical protein ACI9CF_001594 [Candidatus Omnitrophota bacterium]|jgi:hypothetical protein